MNYRFRLEQFASRPTAVVRRRASLPELSKVIPEACGIVWKVIKAKQIQSAGRHVALYRDEVFNVEVGVELSQPFAGDGEVVGSVIPGGPVAATTHFGNYAELGKAHEAIHVWCRQNALRLIHPCWEIYDHWQDEWNNDPAKIRTDVYYLLKAESAPKSLDDSGLVP